MRRALVAGVAVLVAVTLSGCSKGTTVSVDDDQPKATSEPAPNAAGLGLREIEVNLKDGRIVTCLTALWGDVPLLDCDWDNAQ